MAWTPKYNMEMPKPPAPKLNVASRPAAAVDPSMVTGAPSVDFEIDPTLLAAKVDGDAWKSAAPYATSGIGALGGLLEALAMQDDDSDNRAYTLPGGGGADALGQAGVERPFGTGRMDMTPEQRQSVALALLK